MTLRDGLELSKAITKDRAGRQPTIADIRKEDAAVILARRARDQMHSAEQAARSGLFHDAAMHCRYAADAWSELALVEEAP
jgi:hypothetical protein